MKKLLNNTPMKTILKSAVLLLALAGCSNHPQLDNGQYWQRKNVSESVYLRGTKAQQMLNKDIASCVNELKELERLGQLKDTIPTQYGRVLENTDAELSEWDSPERDGALLAEHTDYHDFNSCMRAKGWERTYQVSYETQKRARETYTQNHVLYKNLDRSESYKEEGHTTKDKDFQQLNG